MSTIWFLLVILSAFIALFALGFVFYSAYRDIYAYVCDELDRCKYFGE